MLSKVKKERPGSLHEWDMEKMAKAASKRITKDGPKPPRSKALVAKTKATSKKSQVRADTTTPAKPRTVEDATNERSGGSRSVQRTCAILCLVGEAGDDGVTLVDVAAATQLPKSSAHRYLQVLESERFIERDLNSSRYRLGVRFMSLQSGHIERLIQRTRPFLAKIRDQFDETVNLGMLVGHQIIYLDILESPHAMRLAARKGDTESIHATALGKAIAATLSDRDVLQLLNRTGMKQITKRTITTPEEYLRELQRVRAAGYAIDDRENEDEGRCVAVFVPGFSTPMAISLSGVASRFSVEAAHEVANSLRIAAIEISGEDLPSLRELEVRRAA